MQRVRAEDYAQTRLVLCELLKWNLAFMNHVAKKLTVHGSRNLVFIGHFPKLKMCEGSGNENAGQANCCVLFAQKTKTQVQQCSATRRRALKEFDGDCPSGTFNIRHTCEELGEWCHDIDGALGGCMDCRQCNSYDTCPSCAPYYRKN